MPRRRAEAKGRGAADLAVLDARAAADADSDADDRREEIVANLSAYPAPKLEYLR